jgi:hypothetical protein
MTTNPPTIGLQPCSSSQVKAYGYDAETRTLAVQFISNNALYHYADVPAEVFEAMKAAPSVGAFFGKSIRPHYVCTKQPDPVTGIVFGLLPAQEPKYTTATKTGRLTNRQTGKPIPDDEPVFVLRAQDIHALHALRHYLVFCTEPDQQQAVGKRIAAFEAFAAANPGRMKEPDDVALSAA